MHRCYICLGSNTDPHTQLVRARAELITHFPDIVFGEEMVSKPYGLLYNANLFHNQTACFHSFLTTEELHDLFKHIEHNAGRLPEHKQSETVVLDIDLVRYDDRILKPADIDRCYMRFPNFR